MFKVLLYSLLLVAVVFGAAIADEPKDDSAAVTAINADTSKVDDASADRVYAYYFHGDVRCVTCKKLEAYSGEALTTGFEKEIADSTLVWQAVNYDREANKHYLEDFQLYTKSLVLFHMKDGKITDWKNLDKIWKLVGDKDDYIKYVQSETKKFIEGKPADE